jgi:hypothetical protein
VDSYVIFLKSGEEVSAIHKALIKMRSIGQIALRRKSAELLNEHTRGVVGKLCRRLYLPKK